MIDFNEEILNKLVKYQIIKKDNVQTVLDDLSSKQGSNIYDVLLSLSLLDEANLKRIPKDVFGITFIEVASTSLNFSLLDKISPVFVSDNRVIPYHIQDGVLLALVDNPSSLYNAYFLQTLFSLPVDVHLISKGVMDDLITQMLYVDKRNQAITDLSKEDVVSKVSEDQIDKYLSAPAVLLANTLLEEAVTIEASDIHIEPMMNDVRVRYRIDGVLTEHCRIESTLYQALLARYKIMSQLDIAERRIPQDGKISMTIKDKEYDFRISTIPNIYGEKIVIRVYNTLGDQMTVSKLTTEDDDQRKIRNLIRSPHGIILLTGPTGSGKTTTLYAFLKELNKPGVNIQTVEDPVENQVDGVNQLQVNSKTGLTFASALRSILRQDPNIIMIGEIRDEETAHIAVQAAITGHLVFSTIHTNDAVTTIPRLIDMGVEPYLVSDSLIGALSQRLMRKLCPYCKKEHIIDEHESKALNLAKGTKVYESHGCPRCNGSGYKGRVAVFEILEMNKNVKNSIDEKKFGSEELTKAAIKDGLIFLSDRARKLVKDGITSIDEYNALISHLGE